MKYEKEFRKAHPETIGETDKAFDNGNYTVWLEQQIKELKEEQKDLAKYICQHFNTSDGKNYEDYLDDFKQALNQ